MTYLRSEVVEKVAESLKLSFMETVSKMAGKPFQNTGVSVPDMEIWLRYAEVSVSKVEDLLS